MFLKQTRANVRFGFGKGALSGVALTHQTHHVKRTLVRNRLRVNITLFIDLEDRLANRRSNSRIVAALLTWRGNEAQIPFEFERWPRSILARRRATRHRRQRRVLTRQLAPAFGVCGLTLGDDGFG